MLALALARIGIVIGRRNRALLVLNRTDVNTARLVVSVGRLRNVRVRVAALDGVLRGQNGALAVRVSSVNVLARLSLIGTGIGRGILLGLRISIGLRSVLLRLIGSVVVMRDVSVQHAHQLVLSISRVRIVVALSVHVIVARVNFALRSKQKVRIVIQSVVAFVMRRLLNGGRSVTLLRASGGLLSGLLIGVSALLIALLTGSVLLDGGGLLVSLLSRCALLISGRLLLVRLLLVVGKNYVAVRLLVAQRGGVEVVLSIAAGRCLELDVTIADGIRRMRSELVRVVNRRSGNRAVVEREETRVVLLGLVVVGVGRDSGQVGVDVRGAVLTRESALITERSLDGVIGRKRGLEFGRRRPVALVKSRKPLNAIDQSRVAGEATLEVVNVVLQSD